MGERKRETVKEREREREREREKDEESMRIGKERKGKVPENRMCQNCMPTMNVNTLPVLESRTTGSDEKCSNHF